MITTAMIFTVSPQYVGHVRWLPSKAASSRAPLEAELERFPSDDAMLVAKRPAAVHCPRETAMPS